MLLTPNLAEEKMEKLQGNRSPPTEGHRQRIDQIYIYEHILDFLILLKMQMYVLYVDVSLHVALIIVIHKWKQFET